MACTAPPFVDDPPRNVSPFNARSVASTLNIGSDPDPTITIAFCGRVSENGDVTMGSDDDRLMVPERISEKFTMEPNAFPFDCPMAHRSEPVQALLSVVTSTLIDMVNRTDFCVCCLLSKIDVEKWEGVFV